MTVMRGRVPVVFIWLILGWSEYFSGRRTCDGGEAASGCAHDVVAGNHGLKSLVLYVNAVPGPVHLCPVPGEDVADPPAGIDLVDLIAVLDAVGPGVVLDGPVVALDVDPPGGGRFDHAGAVELVAEDLQDTQLADEGLPPQPALPDGGRSGRSCGSSGAAA